MAETTTTEAGQLPTYLQPFVPNMLAQSQALTAAPLPTYTGDRTAGFSDTQTQTMLNAQGMGPSGQLGAGSDLAYNAGIGALSTQYNPMQAQMQGVSTTAYNPMQAQHQGVSTEQFGGAQAQQYMSPYIQNVIDQQQRDSTQRWGIAGQQQAAQQVKSGGYGGARQAIMDSELQRNASREASDIYGTGMQSAYTNAQQQFNADQARGLQAGVYNSKAFQDAQDAAERSRQFGSNLNQAGEMHNSTAFQNAQQLAEQSRQFGGNLAMQGITAANTSANALANLGKTQFDQEMDANRLNYTYGAAQQNQAQQGLDTAYADFLTQQNDPYKRLAFQSDMLKNVPMYKNTLTQQNVNEDSNWWEPLAAVGSWLYGKKNGGVVRMANGGIASLANGGDVGAMAQIAGIFDPKVLTVIAQQNQGTPIGHAARARLEELMHIQLAVKGAQGAQAPADPLEAGIGALPTESLRMAEGGIVPRFSEGNVVPGLTPEILKLFTPEQVARLEAQVKADREKKAAAPGYFEIDKNAPDVGAEERARYAPVGGNIKEALLKAGAAIADTAALPVRGVVGAYDTAVVSPMRAAGINAGYLSKHLVPEGASTDSMTPFYDRMVRAKEVAPPAPTGKTATFSAMDRDIPYGNTGPKGPGIAALRKTPSSVAGNEAPQAEQGVGGRPNPQGGRDVAAAAAAATPVAKSFFDDIVALDKALGGAEDRAELKALRKAREAREEQGIKDLEGTPAFLGRSREDIGNFLRAMVGQKTKNFGTAFARATGQMEVQAKERKTGIDAKRTALEDMRLRNAESGMAARRGDMTYASGIVKGQDDRSEGLRKEAFEERKLLEHLKDKGLDRTSTEGIAAAHDKKDMNVAGIRVRRGSEAGQVTPRVLAGVAMKLRTGIQTAFAANPMNVGKTLSEKELSDRVDAEMAAAGYPPVTPRAGAAPAGGNGVKFLGFEK